MHDSLRSFLAFAAFMLASLWLAAPATAWKVHTTEHLSSPVAVDQHHHHADDGSPIDDGDAPSDQKSPGHNHVLSGAASLNATVAGEFDMPPVPAVAMLPVGGITPALHELRKPPPSEPPRAR